MINPRIIDYQLIRTNKKNLSLQIKSGKLIARAPLIMPKIYIDNFILKKQKWINKRLTQKAIEPSFKDGDNFFYLGEKYTLISKDCELYFNGVNFIGRANKESFLSLYKENFARIIGNIFTKIAKENNFNYNQIRLKSQKTLWGSCSAKNNINLNYLLMQAPILVIESVIIHELCHTIHKNHGLYFWKLVYKIMPNYKKWHNWLKKHSRDKDFLR